jgi:hypothetical protein
MSRRNKSEFAREEWVYALRSDKYKDLQVTGALKTAEGFCALGVLCDVMLTLYPRDGGVWKKIGSEKGVFLYAHVHEDIQESRFLPLVAQYWVGLDAFGTLLEAERFSVYSLNDRGYSFSHIADIIEHYLL